MQSLLRAAKFLSVAASVAALAVAGLALLDRRNALMGSDFTLMRREALALFPRGSRLAEANRALIDMGFRCYAIPHELGNVDGPSLGCDSNGRGYPVSPRVNVTVMARNGLVSDIEVWNGFDTADADAEAARPVGPHDRQLMP